MNEIEEKFYKTFGIEKKRTCSHSDTCYNGSFDDCEGCNAYIYPEITDRILLQLLCELIPLDTLILYSDNINDLRQEILEKCIETMEWINNPNYFKEVIQSFFTDGEE